MMIAWFVVGFFVFVFVFVIVIVINTQIDPHIFKGHEYEHNNNCKIAPPHEQWLWTLNMAFMV